MVDDESAQREEITVTDWQRHFSSRELAEVDFARDYIKKFNHGTSGHLALTVIDKMSRILNGELR